MACTNWLGLVIWLPVRPYKNEKKTRSKALLIQKNCPVIKMWKACFPLQTRLMHLCIYKPTSALTTNWFLPSKFGCPVEVSKLGLLTVTNLWPRRCDAESKTPTYGWWDLLLQQVMWIHHGGWLRLRVQAWVLHMRSISCGIKSSMISMGRQECWLWCLPW